MKKIIHFFRTPALTENQIKQIMILQPRSSPDIKIVKTEYCFNVEITEELNDEELTRLGWLLSETFEPDKFSSDSFLLPELFADKYQQTFEVGPRLNFTTAWSTNAVEVCRNCRVNKITRIERSRRFLVETPGKLSDTEKEAFLTVIHDRMTECEYHEPLQTFETNKKPEPVREIQIIEKGQQALVDLNDKLGLGLDDWDINYYYGLFTKDIGRNPTDVECFDLSQSNSEHSRHWFFQGKLIVNGKEAPHTLMGLLKKPRDKNPGNSVIAFNDNSSSIKGYKINTIIPIDPGISSSFKLVKPVYNPIFTAETHNFPSGIAPFPGAETGAGGRIRDIQATGTGGLVVAGATAYCVGNLQIPGYKLSWEDTSVKYPFEMASPLKIEIEASNGASDYGNKFGEPVIQGYTRSFGMRVPSGERYEWLKPIMFTSGIGQMNAEHTK
ncbi:MAG TPA: phosphoribosylformylglycinamidine synthase, partial [candidate division Zixibacteria bacterium]|nr:phosphoribosylformylglycinamidine synthase [candidate division Zixibacteria bacterium]